MGTDIHFFVETYRRGKWHSADTWEQSWYYAGKQVPYGKEFFSSRSYDTFAILADVMNGVGFAGVKTGDGFQPISGPRGLPAGLSPELEAYADAAMEHTPSWLSLQELLSYDWTQRTKKTGVVTPKEYARFKATGKPEEWSGMITGQGIKIWQPEDFERAGELTLGLKSARDWWSLFHDRNEAEAKFVQALGGKPYCQVEWEVVYYETAGEFLAKTMPRLWRLVPDGGSFKDVRVVFWFDS